METGSYQSVDELILNVNPFDRPLFVKKQDIGDSDFPDLPSLNTHVSDAIIDAVNETNSKQKSFCGITVRAEKGCGKTHLISRIASQLYVNNQAMLVYMGEYGDLSKIKQEFLQALASSLNRKNTENINKWQELATAMLLKATGKNCTPQQLVNGFTSGVNKNPDLINQVTTKVMTNHPNLDNPYLVRAILWTLSKSHSHYAINWLAGRGLATSDENLLGLPNSVNHNPENESFNNTCQLLDLIGDYFPVVICFDELDDVAKCSQTGFTRAQVVASFAKDLSNRLQRIIIVSFMYPETFRDEIKYLPQAEAVIDRIGQKVLDLNPLNGDEVIELVSLWLNKFYQKYNLTPPYAVYPFNEDQLRNFSKEKPLARQVLKWCRDNWKVPAISITSSIPINRVQVIFEKELQLAENTIQDDLENQDKIAQVLRCAFSLLKGKTIEGVDIIHLEDIEPQRANQGYIDFKIVGNDHGTIVKIGVSVLQLSGGQGVQATLKRLIDYDQFDLTRGCLVRSKSISSAAKKAHEYLQTLLKDKQGEWVVLLPNHLKPLIVIYDLWTRFEDYNLTQQEILNFIEQEKLLTDNYLIREILSSPTGEIPDNAVNDSIPISVPSFDEIDQDSNDYNVIKEFISV